MNHLPTFGLVGKADTGKTTFLRNVLNLPNVKKRTEKPYFRLVDLPSGSKVERATFVDSVGQNPDVQFSVQSLCNTLILFIDHSSSSTAEQLDEERMQRHLEFIKDLVASKAHRRVGPRRILILPNKVDLWGNDKDVRTRFEAFCEEVRLSVLEAQSYQQVELYKGFSAERADDAASLLRVLAEGIEA